MKTNTSDLVRQMNIVSEEHEQVLRELKNMQSVVGYISHLLDAYNIMSTRVDELEEEIKALKRGKTIRRIPQQRAQRHTELRKQ